MNNNFKISNFLSIKPDETMLHGRLLATEILKSSGDNKPRLILLSGQLGAGKTLWTSGFVNGLGIESCATSPSFTLMNIYRNEKIRFFHLDLYRMESFIELIDIGLYEILDNNEFCVIEWADRFCELSLWPHWNVKIQVNQDSSRLISCNLVLKDNVR